MPLEKYREKRRFERTPEPRGRRGGGRGGLRFVVQKHEATRLHYDFRLEMEGVLKSWAVPKGPSLNPEDKRLAIMVEDHPLEYADFEGTIPEGNYGAGTVMVWDRGTYEPVEPSERAGDEQTLQAGLDKGHLRFVLHGEKLRGEFSLVQLKRGKENEWLLIKHRDAFATEEDIPEQDRSGLSGLTMAEIAEGRRPRPRRKAAGGDRQSRKGGAEHRAVRDGPPDAPAGPMPRRVKPMLATPVAEPFDREGWVFEIKWDGYRAVAEIEQGKVRLYSRNFISFEKRFAPLVRALAGLGHDAVLDGEVVVLDAQGKPRFQLVQNYQKTGKGALVYYVFDLLYLDGNDLRDWPLLRRKEELARLLKGQSNILLSEHVEEHGVAFFQAAARQGLEGIMAKNGASPYRAGIRSRNWLKLKMRQQQEAVIGGFTEPRGSRQEFGALVLGVYEGDDLVCIGKAGGGFDTKTLAEVRARLEPLLRPSCPFKKKPKTDTPAHWVEPKLVCEVAFQEWTEDGTMRHPIFLGMREDKPAHAVHREMPEPLADVLEYDAMEKPSVRSKRRRESDRLPARSAPAPLPAGKFSNIDKVYWPEDGYRKGDLLRYYHEVASVILPHLRDRPLSLHRHPNGIHGKSFFQKDVSRQPPPEWVQTATIASESRGEDVRYMICQNEETLLYIANLGCIEINPWNSRLVALDKPDYMVIDLDPQDVPFEQVVEAAHAVRRWLEKGCGECFCKTSGKRGLHIYVPLAARYDYDHIRQFAEIVARQVHHELPGTTSLLRQPAQRRHKVYLDFLQNRRGQTMAAAYSLRPVAGALVSTPLRWREVNKSLDPARFNIENIPRRLDKVGDLWAPVLGKGIDLEKCLSEQQGRQ